MRWRTIRRTITTAIRANILPGLLLQGLMAVFVFAYLTHDGTRDFLSAVAGVKQQSGLAFAFFSYVVAAAVLPEILRIVFFQSGRPERRNLLNFLAAAPAWGVMGMIVDVFYRYQSAWFGDGASLAAVVPKVIVDQLLFSPLFSNPVMVGYFALCAGGFRREAWGEVLQTGFYVEKVVPVMVAGWMIWIPGVSVVYSMPQLLQIPVAVIIQCFWVLVFTTIGERHTDKR
jgi:hypothetical protein